MLVSPCTGTILTNPTTGACESEENILQNFDEICLCKSKFAYTKFAYVIYEKNPHLGQSVAPRPGEAIND